MTTQPATSSQLLGFLVFERTPDKDGFISALMVTDARGYPLEFRATTPVRPSVVQRTLYGRQLEHYVGVELCGKALLQQSQRKAKVVIVPQSWLLDIAAEAQTNMLAIWRAGEAFKPEDEGKAATAGTIKSPGSSYPPLVYKGRFVNPAQEKEAIALLEECNQRFDLVEAFERMRAALELLAKQDPHYA